MKSQVCNKPRAVRARYLRSETLPWLGRRDRISQKLFEITKSEFLKCGDKHVLKFQLWTDSSLAAQSSFCAMAHWVLKEFNRRERRAARLGGKNL